MPFFCFLFFSSLYRHRFEQILCHIDIYSHICGQDIRFACSTCRRDLRVARPLIISLSVWIRRRDSFGQEINIKNARDAVQECLESAHTRAVGISAYEQTGARSA